MFSSRPDSILIDKQDKSDKKNDKDKNDKKKMSEKRGILSKRI